jgi:phage FluMu protein Com
MQIRCQHCHKPFALNKQQILSTLDEMAQENLNYYNYPCPHCSRVNRVTKRALIRFAPEWQKKQASNV